jgi:hypothetical protein
LTAIALVNLTVSSVPASDAITVTKAEFRASGNEWRVEGTGTADGNTVTVYVGDSLDGTVVGSVQVAGGFWSLRVDPGVSLPAGVTTVSVESSGGATILARPLDRIR